MDKLQRLKLYCNAECIYSIAASELGSTLYELLDGRNSDEAAVYYYSELIRLLSSHGSLKEYISELVLADDNVFTRAAASGKVSELPPYVIDGVRSDLEKLEALSDITKSDILGAVSNDAADVIASLPKLETGEAKSPLGTGWADKVEALAGFHRTEGYGEYVRYSAFKWNDGELVPITSLDGVTLDALKKYERQKSQVLSNTLAFLDGYPSNNVLLYGDRGTGKSSTVHAILNEYRSKGLRMIEISKRDINSLSQIRELISDSPLKFIIFIDDLSFDSGEDSFGELKAALEGSLSGRQSNSLIYATSNRRHLIKETFSDRENDVHRSDTLQEELSLSDRFGLSVYYENPDKNAYLEITEKIARDRGLKLDFEKLLISAENWARRRGGRSPRCARQFVDYVESCEKQNLKWN